MPETTLTSAALKGRRDKVLLSVKTGPGTTVMITCPPSGSLRVNVGQLPAGTAAARVELALTETGLSSQIGRGENASRLLHHAAVVRAWREPGAVGADGTFTATTSLPLNVAWKTAILQAVVLVQETASHHVVGVASLPLAVTISAVNQPGSECSPASCRSGRVVGFGAGWSSVSRMKLTFRCS